MSVNVERLMLVAALAGQMAMCLFLLRRKSPMHLFVLTAVSTALVGGFFPVMSLLVEPSSWRNVVHVPEALMRSVQSEYVAFGTGLLLSVVAAWALGGLSFDAPTARPAPRTVDERARVRHRHTVVSVVLLLFGGFLYALYVKSVGIGTLVSRDDYAEKYLVSQGLGPLAFGLNLMMAACLWGEASDIARFLKWTFRTVAIAISVWSIAYISVRTNFVVLCIGYAWILCQARGFQLRRVRISLVIALVFVYAGLECFSLFRGASRGADTGRAIEMIAQYGQDSLSSIVGGSELTHPFLTTVEVVQSERDGDLGGASYVNSLPAFLPLVIMPDRPITLSEKFVKEQYADLAERGGGASYSIVAEAWFNFGSILGPLIVGLLVGCALLFVEHRAIVAPEGTWSRLAPYLVYMVVITHRSESAILVKQGFSILIPVLLLEYAAELTWMARTARLSARSIRRPADPLHTV